MENTNVEINNTDSEETLEDTLEVLEESVEAVEPVVVDTESKESEKALEEEKAVSTKESKTKKKEVKTEDRKKVAVYSERNLYKYELGELLKGYSILPSAKAEKWVASTKKVRIATPEEVAKYYNK